MRNLINIIETLLPSDWDLGGAWITDNGNVEPCDHASDRHHSDIALEYFQDYISTNDDGEHDDYSKDSAQDLAYDNGWIRINTRGTRSISVEWRHKPTAEAKQMCIKYLSEDATAYETYEVEAIDTFRQFHSMKSLVIAIRSLA